MTEPPALQHQMGSLLLAVVLACLLHLVNISPPSLALCLAMWGYTFFGLYRPLPKPGPRILTVAGTFCFFVAAVTNEGVTVEAFVSLLVLMIALKLFELKRQRDVLMAVILNFFVIASGMFFNDSLLVTAYIGLCIIYNTAVMIRVGEPSMSLRVCLRYARRFSLEALPFMIVLFLIFPRVPGGLWGRPKLVQQPRSGVSDTLRPGSLASVAQNYDVAFRVSFVNPMPSLDLAPLYWRGLILDHFDGESWTRGAWQRGAAFLEEVKATANPYAYTIILEPHQERWLFSLDRPLSLQSGRGVRMSVAGPLESVRPVTSRLQYSLSSDLQARLLEVSPGIMSGGASPWLQLPEGGNPRARNLAQTWKNEHKAPEALAAQALHYLRKGNFRYTREPGALPESARGNTVDAFLFQTQAGYCEHFATAFVFLMRAAGVPARLIEGYVGGELNPYGNYLIVRQANAHVWCEVLIEHEWRRVDPTAAISPGSLLASVQGQNTSGGNFELSDLWHGRLPAWLQPLGNGWDFVNMRWNQWVMQYSQASQRKLFSHFGFDAGRLTNMIGLVIGGAALLGIGYFLFFVFFKRAPDNLDPVAREWRRFLQKLDALHFSRGAGQGPQDLWRALKKERPELGARATELVALYIRLRYERMTPNAGELLLRFAEAVKRFPRGK